METRDLRSREEWPEDNGVQSGKDGEERTVPENQTESMVADILDDLAQRIREYGNTVKQRVDREIDFYTQSASDRIENFAECIRSQEIDALLSKTRERFGTKQVLILGSVLVSGIALAAYLKSRE